MKSKIFLLCCLTFSGIAFTACDDDDDEKYLNVITESTQVTNVVWTPDSTGTAGVVTADYYLEPDEDPAGFGVCYTVDGTEPTVNHYCVKTSDYNLETRSFRVKLTDINPGLTYTMRAYVALYGGGVYYSDTFKLNPAQSSEELDAYQAPSYSDDYSKIAGWDQRGSWQLANVHDPSVVKADDGYYYMYQTDASYGNVHAGHGHFHARRSKDLVDWEYLGATMPELPEWVVPKLNEIRVAQGLPEVTPDKNAFGYWAPVVRKVNSNLYRMYYSIVCPGSVNGDGTWGERAFIGLMENSDPSNNEGWVDKGYVITNSTDKAATDYGVANDWGNALYKYNAIDPSYIITDNNEHWLVYGSWHSGIAAIQVDAETGVPAIDHQPWEVADEYGVRIYTRQDGNRWQASEGPEIIYRNGYFYLFLAYDALDVPYNTRVVRSSSITGPYVGIDGTDCTAGGDAFPIVTHPYKFGGHPGWVGFSHCAVFDDGAGNWYYASQGRLPEGAFDIPAANAIMMGHVRQIRWTNDGWPVVLPERYGAVPNVAITEEELVGKWEHIDLAYNYGQMAVPVSMTLGEDHTVTEGKWQNSTWSFDPVKNILKVGTVELCVARECDWEASPRTHTLVYSGLSGKDTFWGKKVK